MAGVKMPHYMNKQVFCKVSIVVTKADDVSCLRIKVVTRKQCLSSFEEGTEAFSIVRAKPYDST